MTTATKPREVNRFHTTAWRLMRLSGLLIIPLVFGHLYILHLVQGVHEITYEWVIENRWALLGWRIYDAFLLWFAGAHGLNGFRHVLNDYVRNPRTNRIILGIAIVLMGIALALGSIALIAAPTEAVAGIAPR